MKKQRKYDPPEEKVVSLEDARRLVKNYVGHSNDSR